MILGQRMYGGLDNGYNAPYYLLANTMFYWNVLCVC
jgi:hypothetical protein